MNTCDWTGVVGRIRRVVGAPAGSDAADADLLERFVTGNDAAAFNLLLERHGPMVLGVCRRVLRNHADAEDAFQATFLVLVRKAAGIRPRTLVGNWLYGVAHKAALKALAMNQTRRVKERRAGRQPVPRDDHDQAQLVELLDMELSKLPDVYRTAVVVCELEGRSIQAAAELLGWPAGTVASRLSRGRRLLARRLRDLGFPAAAAGLSGLLASARAAPVPALLSAAARGAAGLLTGGGPQAAATWSASAAALAEDIMKTMLLDKLKHTLGSLLLCAACASAALLLPWAQGQERPPSSAPQPPVARATAIAQPPAPAGMRKVLETLDWWLIEVDTINATISVSDHAGAGKPSLVIRTTPQGNAVSGLTLQGVRVAEKAEILLDGKKAALGDLQPGQRVTLGIGAKGGLITKISALTPRPPVFRYVLKSVDAKASTLTATLPEKQLELDRVPVANDAKIQRVMLTPAVRLQDLALEDLEPGMHLSLQMGGDADGGLRVTGIMATKPE